ncbi:MAG: hypothetical protein K6U00_03065 [Armatimonadetes bacterium]|nr:hypothetical protein [Armatimonadota bacterium]
MNLCRPSLMAWIFLSTFAILLFLAHATDAQSVKAKEFLESICGDWIGNWDHTTNGEKVDSRYFHVRFKRTTDNTYDSLFTYYRLDVSSNTLVPYGETSIVCKVGPDGKITNYIKGNGTVLVDNKSKPQKHELIEVLTGTDDTTWTGSGSGKIQVDDLPFGVGKNGRVHRATSVWSLNGDTLTITETLHAQFKVLFFSKDFVIEANAKAERGKDVASLIGKGTRIAERRTDRPS